MRLDSCDWCVSVIFHNVILWLGDQYIINTRSPHSVPSTIYDIFCVRYVTYVSMIPYLVYLIFVCVLFLFFFHLDRSLEVCDSVKHVPRHIMCYRYVSLVRYKIGGIRDRAKSLFARRVVGLYVPRRTLCTYNQLVRQTC